MSSLESLNRDKPLEDNPILPGNPSANPEKPASPKTPPLSANTISLPSFPRHTRDIPGQLLLFEPTPTLKREITPGPNGEPWLLRFTLSNGVKVCLLNQEFEGEMETMAVFPVGARYDPPLYEGMAHFLEHTRFRWGLQTLNDIGIHESQLTKAFQARAGTSADYTIYEVGWREGFGSRKILWSDKEAVLQYLTNLLFHRPTQELTSPVEKERSIISVERREREWDLATKIYYAFTLEAFFPRYPCREQILGSDNSCTNFSEAALRDFETRFYRPDMLTLFLRCKWSPEIDALLENTIGKVPANPAPASPLLSLDPCWEETLQKRLYHYHVPQQGVYTMLCFPGIPTTDPDYPTACVMDQLLDNSVGPLMATLREEAALIYSPRIKSSQIRNHAFYNTQWMTADASSAEQALNLFAEAISRIKGEWLTEERLKGAKESAFNSTPWRTWFHDIMHDVVEGRTPVHPHNLKQAIQTVNTEDIKRVIERIFNLQLCRIGLAGNEQIVSIKLPNSYLQVQEGPTFESQF